MTRPADPPARRGHDVEIERKFLVREVPGEYSDAPSVPVRQGYLVGGPDGEVRVRDAGRVHTLTVKSRGDLTRDEYEIALTPGQFDALWPATAGRRLEKTRCSLALGSLTAELDVYAGGLEGLQTVEVEFPTVEAARAFVPPAWFGREVTADAAYKNASLASRGLPQAGRGEDAP